MANIDVTNPADVSVIANFPVNERASRRAILDAVTGDAHWGGTSGGTANAQTVTVDLDDLALNVGLRVVFIAGFSTTSTTPTLNVNGLGAVNIVDRSGDALAADVITAASVIEVVMTTLTEFRLVTPPTFIDTASLVDGAVTTVKIADANVTTAKIADAAVTTPKIAALSVGTGKVIDGAVTNVKLSADAVRDNVVQTGGLNTTSFADDSITQAKVANASIGRAQLKTATADVTGTIGADAVVDIIMTEHTFFPNIQSGLGAGVLVTTRFVNDPTGSDDPSFRLHNTEAISEEYYVEWRFVKA